MDGENKLKKIIIFSIVIIVIAVILISTLVIVNKSKLAKIEKEKEEKAASLQADVFLNAFSKENWNTGFEKGCNQTRKGLHFQRFSWLDGEGNPKEMDGYILGMSFANKKTAKGCGSVSKFGQRATTYFKLQDFIENPSNTNVENNIYAFENFDFKCVYGYGEVEDKETFYNFSIVCGRENVSFSNADFLKIYTMYNPDKENNRMIVIDRFIDVPEGNFAKGRIITGFYFDLPKKFIVKKNIKGEWESLGNPFGATRIDSCWNLFNNNCPPAVANNKCYDTEKKGFIRYDVFYKEKSK